MTGTEKPREEMPRDELLARLIHMHDVCGLNPVNGIRYALDDGAIDNVTALWLTEKMLEHLTAAAFKRIVEQHGEAFDMLKDL